MSSMLKRAALSVATLAIVGTTALQAAPLTVASSAAVGFDKGGAGVEQVAYRRRYVRGYGGYYGGRRYYGPGPGAVAAGAALGLLGAGVAAAAAAPAYGYGYGYYPSYGYGGYPYYGY